jgi:uncharacterized glyoxalase superfamily protein PhnB
MKLDAVAITSRNFKKTVEFYSVIGFTFPDFSGDEKHIEPITKSGDVRLMIDDVELITGIMGVAPVPPTHSSFAMLCDSAKEVDEVVNKIKSSGFEIVKEPWDAFWGQRYAIVKDPDGYMVDLFANL